ncbi:MAG: M20 family metallopeptidase [Candidatus Omnitrophica bacterium]|jgi:acetylornithine deacetylase/succinyl-diaminopimelate desuccinylase family protein|nr:M20 family metallopeptidase [Candidatus Omnitrophota bacterium]
MIRKQRLTKLIQKLISIDSQNPPGNEKEIACFVQKFFLDLGIKSRIYEFRPRRSNLVAVLKGSNSNHKLLLTPHLDTVPAGKSWKLPAFSGLIRKDRIYGLGSTDCKGNLAVMMEAVNSIVEDGMIFDYDLVLAATADEESGSDLGLIPLIKRKILKVDAALVLDADDFEVVVAQKGLLHLKVRISGKKAHGAYPWLGDNAIESVVRVLTELKAQNKRSVAHQYLHPPTVNIGTICGGDKVNVVADWCEFELDFRFLPGSTEKPLLENLKKILAKHSKKFSIQVNGVQAPYQIDLHHPLVNSLITAMKNVKIKPRVSGSEGATVITFFQDQGIPAVATGFGKEGCAHIADEFALLSSLTKGAKVLVEFLRNYKAS